MLAALEFCTPISLPSLCRLADTALDVFMIVAQSSFSSELFSNRLSSKTHVAQPSALMLFHSKHRLSERFSTLPRLSLSFSHDTQWQGSPFHPSTNGYAQFTEMVAHQSFAIAFHHRPAFIQGISRFIEFRETHLPCVLDRIHRMWNAKDQILAAHKVSALYLLIRKDPVLRPLNAHIVAAPGRLCLLRRIHRYGINHRVFIIQIIFFQPCLKVIHQLAVFLPIFTDSSSV